jgi:hypothetical protein
MMRGPAISPSGFVIKQIRSEALIVSNVIAARTPGSCDWVDATSPSTRSLLKAPHDEADWILPATIYAGNRFTTLTQINKGNEQQIARERADG